MIVGIEANVMGKPTSNECVQTFSVVRTFVVFGAVISKVTHRAK